MKKEAIKNFAVWAREELIKRVAQKAFQYGIKEDGVDPAATSYAGHLLTAEEMRQRDSLAARISRDGYQQVIEAVAYTWFNRFCALRFMEVNGYLSMRVLSSEDGSFQPQILTNAIHVSFDNIDMEKVYALIEGHKRDELYKYLLIAQCNELSRPLPGLFQKIDDETELLFPDNLLWEDSVLNRMVATIEEDDWKDNYKVQIIGWLYQYYNSVPKDQVFADLKKNIKISKDKIPAATQLFTPDWIVRYMVENSLGRLWVERNTAITEATGDSMATEASTLLLSNWKYYLPEAEQTPEVNAKLAEIRSTYKDMRPEDIKVIDPCMGSGHILVYMFDILMQIYTSSGYNTRDAVRSILSNNLYGLDIDDRAAQLSYFAVMMKAQEYDKRFLRRNDNPTPHIYPIMETNVLGGSDKLAMGDFHLPKEHQDTLNYLLDAFIDAKEYGSILQMEVRDFAGLMDAWKYASSQTVENTNMSLWYSTVVHVIPEMIEQAIILSQKYDVVVTNPPYMAVSNAGAKISEFVKKNYPNSKADMFAVFMERCTDMLNCHGFEAMITQQSFLFAPSFTKFRDSVVYDRLVNLLHIGFNSFPELNSKVALGAAFVMFAENVKDYKTRFLDLNSNYPPSSEKEDAFFIEKNRGFCVKSSLFANIPNHALTYSFSEAMLAAFKAKKIEAYIVSDGQTKTGNNDRFLRSIWEVNPHNVGKNAKWALIAKGGDSRKWYGNILDLIDWSDSARQHYRADKVARIAPDYIWFRQGICWNHIATSKGFAARYLSSDTLFETASPAILIDDSKVLSLVMAFLNTPITRTMMELLNPSVCKNVGDVTGLPLIEPSVEMRQKIIELSEYTQTLAKLDWDSFELSWEFVRHPLVPNTAVKDKLELAYQYWAIKCEERFRQLKTNEEELNRIFIDIYDLQNELTPEVKEKDVTARKADLGRDIRSLISYAVGCMFGRYSLDVPGLAFAGGEWDASKYKTFIPDADGILPISNDQYFEDDIVSRFSKFIEVVYGKETLEENLQFIADALGGKGKYALDVIRDYFLNDFYADHLKVYQKRPIYWLFDSGKQNGFKALVYMHRYTPSTMARISSDYAIEQQERYSSRIEQLEHQLLGADASISAKLNKQLQKLRAQETELRGYVDKVKHLADQKIAIDLDDGVKHNYAIFQDVLAIIK